ncbi:DUF7550 family protein [Salinigranum marinum]|jgi:hypothetical protein|uniref:DUF7550 family protein n=1 Tax=Salinigranum marinum TaxID=1515595 RepID=UPI002989EB1D|nr:hypothetical protein [Salinigranum marinum]
MDDHHAGDHDHGDHQGSEGGRVTSPMQNFSTAQVGVGLAVLAVGLLVTFGVPLLAA